MCRKIETHQLTKDMIFTLMYTAHRLFVVATVYNLSFQQFTIFLLDIPPVIQVKIPKMSISYSDLKLALLTSWCQFVASSFSWSPMPQLTHSVLASKSYSRKLLVISWPAHTPIPQLTASLQWKWLLLKIKQCRSRKGKRRKTQSCKCEIPPN